MSPEKNPSVPSAPPPPPVPTESIPVMSITKSQSAPGSPAKESIKLMDNPKGGLSTLSVHPNPGSKRSSFSALLQKFVNDQQFAAEWLDMDDDDNCSIVSVDSLQSGTAGSSISGTLSRQGSYVDLKEAAKSSSEGLSKASLAELDKKMDNVKLSDQSGKPSKRLSQALIWTWLNTSKQTALREEDNESSSPPSTPVANAVPTADQPAAAKAKLDKVDMERLRAKLRKTYPKYYREMNVTSPNNW